MPRYNSNLKGPARELRKGMTEAERILWARLRRKQILNVQFYRQRPFLRFILDFYAPSARLAVEVDGQHHREPHQSVGDQERDAILAGLNLQVLRFSNREILTDLEAVVRQIEQAVKKGLKFRVTLPGISASRPYRREPKVPSIRLAFMQQVY